MMIKRICELRGILTSDQVLRPSFHLTRHKLFGGVNCPNHLPTRTDVGGQAETALSSYGRNHRAQTRTSIVHTFLFPVRVNPSQFLKIPASASLHMHSHYLIFISIYQALEMTAREPHR